MFRFTRTTAAVAAVALTASLYSVTIASANPVGRGPAMHHGHHGGGGYGRAMAVGAGVAVGLMLLNAAVQAQQAQQARPVEVAREPTRVRAPKKPPVVKRVPKVAPPEQITIRTAHPVYVMPKLPDVQKQECNNANCDELWQAIQRYKQMILEDSRKLADREAEMKNRKAELEQYRNKAKTAASQIDRDYFKQMADITENSTIPDLEDSIQSIKNILKMEEDALKDRIAQYEDCVKRACAGQQVGAAPVGITPR